MRPLHSFSPIRFSPIPRKKGLVPRLLKPAPFELAASALALSKPTLFEQRLSSENPWIQVSGFPSLGNHVAHTCTACPSASPAPPPLPASISNYRHHHT